MRTYGYEVAESREAMDLNNASAGARPIAMFKTPGRNEFNRNGATFQWVTTVFSKPNQRAQERELVLATLKDAKGKEHYELMSLANWQVFALMADPISAFCSHERDSVKERENERATKALDLAATLKGCNVPSAAIKAALKAEGYKDTEVEFAFQNSIAKTA